MDDLLQLQEKEWEIGKMTNESKTGALSSILTALEHMRNEVRELQKADAQHMASLAVLQSQMTRIESEVKDLDKAAQSEQVKNAVQLGKNEVKWIIVGVVSTSLIGSLIYSLINS